MKSTICIPDDTSGTGQWRCLWPINLIWPTLQHDENIAVTKTFPTDINYFAVQNSVMIQRWTTAAHRKLFDSAVFPAANGGMSNIIYNIDDCMSPNEIPTFNQAWRHYCKPEIQDNIKYMLQRSDFVVVTTNRLKQYYIDTYSVDPNNFIVVPNLLPRSWAFGLFTTQDKIASFKQSQINNKIRIGIISSASHFNVTGARQTIDTKELVNPTANPNEFITELSKRTVSLSDTEEIPDDIDDIAEVIRKTSDRFEWVSIGESKNTKFKQLVADKKITVVQQTDILHYMRLVTTLNLSAIVAPIKDNTFNHCKSDIKYLEAAAVGALLFTPDLQPYAEHVPDSQRWTSTDDLITKLYNLADMKPAAFGDAIQVQYNRLNTPVILDGGLHLNNWWLDDNIDIWRSIFFMPRKGVKINLSSIVTPTTVEVPKQSVPPAIYGKNKGKK